MGARGLQLDEKTSGKILAHDGTLSVLGIIGEVPGNRF